MVENLVPYDPAHFKTLLAGHRVYDHVAMDPNKVLAVQNRVLVLAGRIDDLQPKVLVPISNHFAECVFDRGVVGIDEMAVDVLDCEGAFA